MDNYSSSVLLLQPSSSATDGSTSIADMSPVGQTLTLHGSVQVDTDVDNPSILSVYGTDDSIEVGNYPPFSLPANTTFEAFLRPTNYPFSYHTIAAQDNGTSGSSFVWIAYASANGTVTFRAYTAANATIGYIVSSSGALPLNTRTHFEISVDSSGIARMFIGGNYVGQLNISTINNSSSYPLYLLDSRTSYTFNNFIGNSTFCVLSGVARHTTNDNFTPPTNFNYEPEGIVVHPLPESSGIAHTASIGTGVPVHPLIVASGEAVTEHVAIGTPDHPKQVASGTAHTTSIGYGTATHSLQVASGTAIQLDTSIGRSAHRLTQVSGTADQERVGYGTAVHKKTKASGNTVPVTFGNGAAVHKKVISSGKALTIYPGIGDAVHKLQVSHGTAITNNYGVVSSSHKLVKISGTAFNIGIGHGDSLHRLVQAKGIAGQSISSQTLSFSRCSSGSLLPTTDSLSITPLQYERC